MLELIQFKFYIMIDHEGHIKLIDFGLSRIGVSSDRNTNSIVGTPNYIAPEILKKGKHTEMIDWWSFGVIIYEMIAGNLPFVNRDSSEK